MISRRKFLGVLSALPIPAALAAARIMPDTKATLPIEEPGADDLTQFVKIAIGTGGHGHTYPGATVPFGMVQLSPDTYTMGWDGSSGYHYADSSIMGFSHTHLSGTGVGDMLDILVMPGTGRANIFPGLRENPGEGYRSRFSHEDEVSAPGYYSVLLRDYNIRAELSATERVGIHRYTFPKNDTSHFIVDLAHHYGDYPVLWAELKILGNDTVVGGRSVQGWAPGREIYFAMKFSKPFASAEIFSDGVKLSGETEAKSQSVKCLLYYSTGNGETILAKTGISGVSTEAAMKNLEAEIPGWNFDLIRKAGKEKWQRELSRIRIETPNLRHKEIFYTGLYHAMVAPTLFDDADGHYRGMDGQIHQLPAGQHNYSTFSLWDIYRTAIPLYTLALADRFPDFVNCLIRMADESPAGVPVWPLQGKETGCMTGYHSSSVIAEAYVKKFQGIDFAKAYPPFRKRAVDDDYRGLGYYRKLGYLPCDKEEESVSKTMEYAYDDWAVAHIARAAGATDDAKVFFERCHNYRNLFDKDKGFIRARFENGDFAEPFDPAGMGYSKKWRDYTESNSWETTFSVQHDAKEYIKLFGGPQAFIEKLDALFNAGSQLPPDAPPDIAGMIGQYAHGNEPCHHVAYLYAYAGVAYKTQERVRSLLEMEYDNQPNGLAGNEDCGQMSAWYVMSALGFYAVDPVSGNYVFGTPLFELAVVQIANGKQLIIKTDRSSPDDKYIQSVTFNGAPYSKVWFRHADVANGATIEFKMGSSPNKQFGAAVSSTPPSMNSSV